MCLRYVFEADICERFLYFDKLHDFSGLGITTKLFAIFKKLGIDIEYIVGQGYDGASAMSGLKIGVQKHVRDKCPAAIYTHCTAHSLNFCLLKAGQVPEVQKAVTLMNDIVFFQRIK